jgi:hypothetical protein
MLALRRARTYLLALAPAVVVPLATVPRAAAPPALSRPAARGGAQAGGPHGFDFEMGTWKTHLTRLLHPLTGSTTWVAYEGRTVVRAVWGGRANLAELEADGPAGHLELLSLRLYDPDSSRWRLYYAGSAGGELSVPAVGRFAHGRGEFFDRETLAGRPITVRQVWSVFTPDSCRFEQSFSGDGGRTWETNWVATDVRVRGAAGDR